ncbi:hypothetical protein BaRGS_00004624 [Batillaria attramentaria]|uniref:Uncharacterized protein n=1 Tax=Batillaria attramentaria TaxID=370345 RepID=A0ABD0LXE7_9CAEN
MLTPTNPEQSFDLVERLPHRHAVRRFNGQFLSGGESRLIPPHPKVSPQRSAPGISNTTSRCLCCPDGVLQAKQQGRGVCQNRAVVMVVERAAFVVITTSSNVFLYTCSARASDIWLRSAGICFVDVFRVTVYTCRGQWCTQLL